MAGNRPLVLLSQAGPGRGYPGARASGQCQLSSGEESVVTTYSPALVQPICFLACVIIMFAGDVAGTWAVTL